MTYKDLNLFIVIILILALALLTMFCLTYYRTRASGNDFDSLPVAGSALFIGDTEENIRFVSNGITGITIAKKSV